MTTCALSAGGRQLDGASGTRVKSTATNATITGLTNGTAYEVQVRAGNSVGDGPWSASASGTPVASASAPAAPSRPGLTVGDGQLGVRWTAPSDNGAAIDDYDVRYRTGGGSWTELPDAVKSTATSATITGLTNGTAYEVQVRAGNSVGDGPWSASATGTSVASASGDRPCSSSSTTPRTARTGRTTRTGTAAHTRPMVRCLHELKRPRDTIGTL